jgi:imidazole glycerol-phosphate synthase subunit HisF
MLKTRIIPTLLLKNGGLVKGVNFKSHNYVGDPINAVKIFNEKEVDELIFLDISARVNGIDYNLIQDVASEAFMPFAYGGGITSVDQAIKILRMGAEKIIIGSAAYTDPTLITKLSKIAGSQSVVVAVDVKKINFGGYEVRVESGTLRTKINPVDYAKKMEELCAGELVLCSIDKEGTYKGYDLNLIKQVTQTLNIPVIASGGANDLHDFSRAVTDAGASAVTAGNMFIYHGKHKAVLITYPETQKLLELFD